MRFSALSLSLLSLALGTLADNYIRPNYLYTLSQSTPDKAPGTGYTGQAKRSWWDSNDEIVTIAGFDIPSTTNCCRMEFHLPPKSKGWPFTVTGTFSSSPHAVKSAKSTKPPHIPLQLLSIKSDTNLCHKTPRQNPHPRIPSPYNPRHAQPTTRICRRNLEHKARCKTKFFIGMDFPQESPLRKRQRRLRNFGYVFPSSFHHGSRIRNYNLRSGLLIYISLRLNRSINAR